MNIQIGKRQIGDGCSCFIIAEAGVNHNGEMPIAKKLIDAAAEAGADAVKFQTFIAEELATQGVDKAQYQKSGLASGKSQLEMLKSLEFGKDEFEELCAYCNKKGIVFLSTPFDFKSADMLEGLNIPAYKISSGDLNNYPFLSYISKKQKPMILSTGMSELDEISAALSSIKKENNHEIIVLQCTSAYPAPYEEIHLNAMKFLREKFKVLVGFSDHSIGIEVSIAAVALGACVVEKHFTLDKSFEGPDHKASINPSELTSLVKSIRHVEASLGSDAKTTNPSEQNTKRIARKKIIAANNIPAGSVLRREHIAFKRNELGLAPSNLEKILNRKTKKLIKKDEPILLESLGDD